MRLFYLKRHKYFYYSVRLVYASCLTTDPYNETCQAFVDMPESHNHYLLPIILYQIPSLRTGLYLPNDLNILVMQRFFCSILG